MVAGGRVAAADSVEPLTTREIEVLQRIAEGDGNKDIARSLGMSPTTVMHDSMSIYRKLRVRGRSEATAWAFRSGLMESRGGG